MVLGESGEINQNCLQKNSFNFLNSGNHLSTIVLINFMGFLKKLKDTAEKSVEKGADLGKQGIEKGTELGTKGYEGAKDAAKKGHDKAKKED